jgi:adenylate cyclase
MADLAATTEFGRRFRLALEALNWSRARCAQELGVHKSIVSRWAAGKAYPTEHNLTRLTELVRRTRPEFVLRSWRLDVETFSRELGSGPRAPSPEAAKRPSVAVLAFDNLSGDPGQGYFSDGVAEDIVTELTRDHSLLVIARSSSFAYRGRGIDVRQIARELDVRYVLTGSVRRSAMQIRVNAQLIDADTGSHVWAERYDRCLTDLFAVQDEISTAVSLAIQPAIAEVERRRAVRIPPESLDAWEAYQRALWHLGKFEAEEHMIARVLLERAIELDPTFSGAYQALVQTYWLDRDLYFTRSAAEVQNLVEPLARKAVALDPGDARAHTVLAGALWNRGDTPGALSRLEKALTLNRNFALAYWIQGACLVDSGQHTAGVHSLRTYLRLAPRDHWNYSALNHIAQANYLAGDYASAVEMARQAFEANPKSPRSYRWHAAALGQLDRTAEAQEIMRMAAAAIAPQTFEEYACRRMPWLRETDHCHMLEGLRKAGWQG